MVMTRPKMRDAFTPPIEAVILAAGRGSRLKSETDERPKCLTEVGGRTLLEHQLNLLFGAGGLYLMLTLET